MKFLRFIAFGLMLTFLHACCEIPSHSTDASNWAGTASDMTGTVYARVTGIDLSVSCLQGDTEFSPSCILVPDEENRLDLIVGVHYTLQVCFEIGGGSIPPAISENSLAADYDANILQLSQFARESEQGYLDYTVFYDLYVKDATDLSALTFTFEDFDCRIAFTACRNEEEK